MQDQWGPMLRELGAPGRAASGGQATSEAVSAGSYSTAEGAAREAHATPASAEVPGGSHQHPPEETGVWASLVATALQAAGARADHASPQNEGPISSPVVEATASAAAEGASGCIAGGCGTGEDSVSPELDSKLASLSIKHPWDEQPFSSMSVTQEPLTFSSVCTLPQQQQQRTRRVVKVVRSTKVPASKVPAVQTQTRHSSSEEQSQEASPFTLPCSNGCEPDVAFRKSTQEHTSTRTRKKRAAATLMEGTSTFHAPPSAPCEHERSNSNPAGTSEPSGQSCCPDHGLQVCKPAAHSQTPACQAQGSTLGMVPTMQPPASIGFRTPWILCLHCSRICAALCPHGLRCQGPCSLQPLFNIHMPHMLAAWRLLEQETLLPRLYSSKCCLQGPHGRPCSLGKPPQAALPRHRMARRVYRGRPSFLQLPWGAQMSSTPCCQPPTTALQLTNLQTTGELSWCSAFSGEAHISSVCC